MKKFLALLALCSLFALPSFAADDGWLQDFEAAKKAAKESNKPILLDFTGSDWCRWCIKLDEEVFSKDVFKTYAKDNLILFKADFPRRGGNQPDAVKTQNRKLAEQFKVEGFPTIFVIDHNEKILGQLGYQPGGPEKYVETIKAVLKNKSK
ncbi:MAG: thioredoxin family protein [Lentisphaerae bacterium]|nr:thioredoxin family protein [Lentisphaerota bacterium]